MYLNSPLKYLAIALLALALSYFGWQTTAKLRSQPPKAIGSNLVSLPGNYYSVMIPSSPKNRYLSAEYRVWIPARIERVRGLLVKQHGCGKKAAAYGLDHARDLQWQALATKHQFALMGTQLTVGDGRCEDWALINYGSRDMFLQAINTVARQSQKNEINTVPWILWGHSGGADWAAQMLQEYPHRTIAMVGLRGGGFPFLGVNQQLAQIPVMFGSGENDTVNPYETNELPQTIFSRYRKLNGLWSLAIEANAGHETANSRWLVIPYLDAVIDMRLAQDSNKLLLIDPTHGWLGNIITHEIASVERYQGAPLEAVWLPNEEVARKWQEYVTMGKVSPTRKPKAPTEVRIREMGAKEVMITWNYTPDLENGLPSFRIYRNNSLVQTLEKQSHGVGDNPSPDQIALEFRDYPTGTLRDRQAQAKSVYQVAAFNELGESISLPVSYGTKNN
ncbi:MAG: hypothetical protein AAF383_06000 [Cyanobacteria bacterium P01_A01_bin.83]